MIPPVTDGVDPEYVCEGAGDDLDVAGAGACAGVGAEEVAAGVGAEAAGGVVTVTSICSPLVIGIEDNSNPPEFVGNALGG